MVQVNLSHRASSGKRGWPSFLLLFLLLVLGLGAVSCVRSPDAPQPSTLTYEGPQTYTLKPGDTLPGTDIRYLGVETEGAAFTIAGEKAFKQKADSLNWSGESAPGVSLVLRLRIIWFTKDQLYAAGTARVTISDVAPQAGQVPAEAPLTYQMPVAYGLAVHATAPGAGLIYEGKSAEGARFSGLEGYPYRQVGDSVRWEGQLRPNVAVRHDLRVVQFDNAAVRLAGVVHLWITR